MTHPVVLISEDDNGTKQKAVDAIEKTRMKMKKGKELEAELDRVWRKIRDDAFALCPKDTGALASTIRVVKVPTGIFDSGWSKIKNVTVYERSIIAGDFTVFNIKTKKPVEYATWVHDGHKMRDGSYFSGVPFLTEAVAQNDVELNRAIERALSKIAKDNYSGNNQSDN